MEHACCLASLNGIAFGPLSQAPDSVPRDEGHSEMFGQKTQPEWFFDSSVHMEALSRLLYLVENHEPLGLIQGSDGSGRSRVLSRLQEELVSTGAMVVSLTVAGLDEESALWQLVEALAVRTRPTMRRHEVLTLLRDELCGRARCGIPTVILLDDFHRAVGDLTILLRILKSMSAQCHGMMTVLLASDRSLPEEFTGDALVPVLLSELDTAESSDFVRSLIGHQAIRECSVDESAVQAISLTSVGNAARMSRMCALLRVVHETSPETRITEDTVYSLLAEFTQSHNSHPGSTASVMRAS